MHCLDKQEPLQRHQFSESGAPAKAGDDDDDEEEEDNVDKYNANANDDVNEDESPEVRQGNLLSPASGLVCANIFEFFRSWI